MRSTFLLVAIFAAFSTTTLAQDENNLPVKGDYGLTFNLTGLVNNVRLSAPNDNKGEQSIFLRYYMKDDLALRMGFGVTSQNRRFTSVDSVGAAVVDYDSTFSKTNFYIAPGIEKHFTGSKRLDPYMGANLLIGILGKETISATTETSDTLGVSTFKVDEDAAGGSVIGLNLSAGFNYFFTQRLAIGAEYSFGLQTMKNGGDWSRVETFTPPSGAGTVNRDVGSNITRSTGFDVSSTAGITLSWFFARKS